MPRGVAFSGKQKKKQLQAKRALKRGDGTSSGGGGGGAGGGKGVGDDEDEEKHNSVLPQQLLTQSLGRSSHHNKWSTVFVKESKEVVEARRIASSAPIDITKRGIPLRPLPRSNLDPVLAHPRGVLLREGRRGRAVYLADDAREVERVEFSLWLERIYARYETGQLNMFEHNMEVWMQLWHTLATADVVCIIADARNPLWHIPESLVDQILNELKKPLLIVLNKTDLVPSENITAWIHYLQNLYPSAHIVPFSASGADLGGAMTLALRRRLLRAARLSRDEAHTSRRIQAARGLLSAAGSPNSAIHVVEQRILATCRAGTRREDALLSVDLSFTSNTVREQSNYADNSLEEEDEEEEEENDDETEDVLINALIDDVVETLAVEEDNIPEIEDVANEEEEEEEEEEIDNANFEARFDTIEVHKSYRYQGHPPLVPNKQSNRRNKGQGNLGFKGPTDIESTSDGDGVDRFAGRPRRYKRGDAGKKVEEMERGFKVADEMSIGGRVQGNRGTSNERSVDKLSPAKKSTTSDEEENVSIGEGSKSSKALHPSSTVKSGVQDVCTGEDGKLIASSEKALLAAEAARSLLGEGGMHRPLTIGMVGHPNVGKSSVINCLCGEKKVSVSRTAGHTKRAQTIHLVQRDEGGSGSDPVDLLDCPGLVFPHALVPQPPLGFIRKTDISRTESVGSILVEKNASTLALPVIVTPGSRQARLLSEATTLALSTGSESSPSTVSNAIHVDASTGEFRNERAMQECCGVIPLAQVREAYSTVRFLAEHLPIERLYGLQMSKEDEEDWHGKWSPLGICENLATKRGYFTARTGRPDGHAAGREILYDAQDGIVPLFWLPPIEKSSINEEKEEI